VLVILFDSSSNTSNAFSWIYLLLAAYFWVGSPKSDIVTIIENDLKQQQGLFNISYHFSMFFKGEGTESMGYFYSTAAIHIFTTEHNSCYFFDSYS
jgi:hypothetical protein